MLTLKKLKLTEEQLEEIVNSPKERGWHKFNIFIFYLLAFGCLPLAFVYFYLTVRTPKDMYHACMNKAGRQNFVNMVRTQSFGVSSMSVHHPKAYITPGNPIFNNRYNYYYKK